MEINKMYNEFKRFAESNKDVNIVTVDSRIEKMIATMHQNRKEEGIGESHRLTEVDYSVVLESMPIENEECRIEILKTREQVFPMIFNHHKTRIVNHLVGGNL